MNTFITGGSGLLGSALFAMEELGRRRAPPRHTFDLGFPDDILGLQGGIDLAFLCAGTKGFAECEGNRKAFLADVDGNTLLAHRLVNQGAFVVFVSTDAVETALGSAYARNRFMVELAIGGLPNVAIFRPGRFTVASVEDCARACAHVGLNKLEGLTRWP